MPTQTPNMRQPSRGEFIALIAALMSLNALAIDIMLPALPHMADALNVVNENDRQLVVSAYLLGFGFTQIIYGPLSDRFGRRPPLMVGLTIYIIAATAAIFSPNFVTLLILRLAQGMGAASTRVIAQSIVRDKFSGRAMAEIMSLVFMVFMIVPVIAPAMGQVLLFTGHWWTIFIFMGVSAALVAAWVHYRLPETLTQENRRPLTLSVITQGFKLVLSNRVSVAYSIATMFLLGALFGFINSSQQVYVEIYGLGVWFPLAFAVMASVMAFSGYINSRMVKHFGMRRISHFAIIVFTTVSALWWGLSLLGPMPLPIFFVLLSLAMFMFGWTTSNMNTIAMEPLGKVAGTASAVFGFFQTIGGALIGLIIGRMFDGTLTPIAAGYFSVGLAALACVLIAEKGKLFGVGDED